MADWSALLAQDTQLTVSPEIERLIDLVASHAARHETSAEWPRMDQVGRDAVLRALLEIHERQ